MLFMTDSAIKGSSEVVSCKSQISQRKVPAMYIKGTFYSPVVNNVCMEILTFKNLLIVKKT